MNRFVSDKSEGIRSAARKYGVRRLYVFGSGVSDDFDINRSDIDVLVEFEASPGGRADRYFGLLEELESLFGRPVDLIEPGTIRNPYFRHSVEASKQLVYDAA